MRVDRARDLSLDFQIQANGGLVCLADVESRPLEWLWPDRIPLGKLTIIAGDPGLGKSLATLDIASRVSQGEPWPDQTDAINPKGDAILLSAEDDLSDTIRPRLGSRQVRT